MIARILRRPPAPPPGATLAVLSLGSSLGDRDQALRLATAALAAQPEICLLRRGPTLRTAAVGGVARAIFLNGLLLVATTLPPHDLLRRCKSLEARLGRQPARRFAERRIDIDILLYGDQIVDLPDLQIPHPRLHERPFFLGLLRRLCPGARDPRTGQPW